MFNGLENKNPLEWWGLDVAEEGEGSGLWTAALPIGRLCNVIREAVSLLRFTEPTHGSGWAFKAQITNLESQISNFKIQNSKFSSHFLS